MVAWQIIGARLRLRNCKTHPTLPFCLLWRFGENTGEVLLPADGGRNDFGPHFAEGVYAYGQLLTEIPRSDIKMIVSKVYFQEKSSNFSSPKEYEKFVLPHEFRGSVTEPG